MMESIYKNVIVYNIWVNGRDIEDVDQHYPVNSNLNNYNVWHSDFKRATDDYFNTEVKDSDREFGYYSEIYQDYIVILFSIDINVNEFENMFDLDFDLKDERVQEMIPYYVDYNLNTIAERIDNFK